MLPSTPSPLLSPAMHVSFTTVLLLKLHSFFSPAMSPRNILSFPPSHPLPSSLLPPPSSILHPPSPTFYSFLSFRVYFLFVKAPVLLSGEEGYQVVLYVVVRRGRRGRRREEGEEGEEGWRGGGGGGGETYERCFLSNMFDHIIDSNIWTNRTIHLK